MKVSAPQIAILWVVLLCVGCQREPVEEFDLVGQASGARWRSVWALEGELAGDEARPFLARRYKRTNERNHLLVTPGTSLDLKLLVFEPQPVKVEILGRRSDSSAKSAAVAVILNGSEIERLELTASWKPSSFSIPAEQLVRGQNLLQFRCEEEAEWKRFSASTGQTAPEIGKESPISQFGLPWGACLEYPLPPGPAREVAFKLSPWQVAGSAAIGEGNWQLSWERRSAAGQVFDSGSTQSFGRHVFTLAASSSLETLTLRLTASTPFPGQHGLAVSRSTSVPEDKAPLELTPSPVPPLAKKPMVVLFVIDTLRPDYLDCYGYSKHSSPRLAEFARDAIRFDQAMASSPWTKPSVATLLTSLSPKEHGVVDFADKLPSTLPTLAEILSRSGYRTLAAWNNALLGSEYGFTRGYQEEFVVRDKIPGTEMVARAIRSLEGLKGLDTEPTCLHLHILDPHEPYDPSRASREKMFQAHGLELGRSEWGASGLPGKALREKLGSGPPDLTFSPRQRTTLEALYAAGVKDADLAFGQLIDWLKERDLYDDALIVVTSDHGEELLDHGHLGHISSLHQELIRIPLLIKMPGRRDAGRVSTEPCSLSQVAPTVLVEALGSNSLPGEPLRLGGTTDDAVAKPVYFEVDAGQEAVQMGQDQLPYLVRADGVRVGRYVFHQTSSSFLPSEAVALYDLASDPGEKNNLLWEQPALALYLQSLVSVTRPVHSQDRSLNLEQRRELDKALRTLQYLR